MIQFPLPNEKERMREEIKVLMKEYLDRGGQIQQIPEGKRGECKPRNPPHQKPNPRTQTATGVRCKTCDWSPTDNRSISNPEIAEYGHNRLEIDELTGDMLCRYCLSAVADMNRLFKVEEDEDYGLSPNFIGNEARREVPLTLDGPCEDDDEFIAEAGPNVLTRQLDNLFDKSD
jgi:hypothetical protein